MTKNIDLKSKYYVYLLFTVVSSVVFALIPNAVTLVLSIVFSSVLFTSAFMINRNSFLCFTVLASVVCAFAISGKPYVALLAIAYLPIAISMSYAIITGKSRAIATAISSGSFIAFMIICLLIYLIFENGGMSVSRLVSLYNSFFELLKQSLLDFTKNAESLAGTELQTINNTVVYAKTYSFGMVVLCSNIIAYVCGSLIKRFVTALMPDAVFKDNKWELEISKVSAVMFVISYMGMSLYYYISIAARTLTATIYLTLIGGVVIAGIRKIKFWYKEQRLGRMLIILLIMCLMFSFVGALALVGVASILFPRRKES